MSDVEQLTEALCYHAEGPVWADGALHWVDMHDGDVLVRDEATGEVVRQHVGSVAAALRPRTASGWVVAVERGFVLLDTSFAELERGSRPKALGELWTADDVRFNDGDCDPQGRFWCGSLSSSPGGAALWRLDHDGTATRVQEGLTTSNGLGWTADGATAYHVDTATGRVDVLDGDLSAGSRRPMVQVEDGAGVPDGLCVDAGGGVWVALFGGGRVRRYLPDGRLDAELRVPVARTTACTLGGPDLRTLYVTTSREDADDPEPEAGAVFTARVDVPGQPVRTFAG